jgi:hypothetical protein
MRLLYLHGAPASGKRTVGAEVARFTGGRLFDNHAAVDFARTLIDFDGPGFWDLVHAARMVALGKAAEHGVPLVIQTSCYSHPDDLPLVEDFETVLRQHGKPAAGVPDVLGRYARAAGRQRRSRGTAEGHDQGRSRGVPRPMEPGPGAPCELSHG